MKAQVTLEFLGAFTLFVLVVIGVLSLTVDEIPQFHSYAETTEKNLEVKRTTDLLLTSPGLHSNNGGGNDWENNVQSAEEPGLASQEMHIDRSKLETLGTVGNNVYNYTSFVNDLGLYYNYNFNFTWFPIVETDRTFIRTQPPSNPDIQEPDTEFYNKSENRVHYGEIDLNGMSIRFLVTAYDENYNTTYVTANNWDFSQREPLGEGDIPPELTESSIGQDFVIERIQNRKDTPGATVILRSDLGEFGRSRQTAEGNIEKLSRYPILDDPSSSNEIVKMEVLVW